MCMWVYRMPTHLLFSHVCVKPVGVAIVLELSFFLPLLLWAASSLAACSLSVSDLPQTCSKLGPPLHFFFWSAGVLLHLHVFVHIESQRERERERERLRNDSATWWNPNGLHPFPNTLNGKTTIHYGRAQRPHDPMNEAHCGIGFFRTWNHQKSTKFNKAIPRSELQQVKVEPAGSPIPMILSK